MKTTLVALLILAKGPLFGDAVVSLSADKAAVHPGEPLAITAVVDIDALCSDVDSQGFMSYDDCAAGIQWQLEPDSERRLWLRAADHDAELWMNLEACGDDTFCAQITVPADQTLGRYDPYLDFAFGPSDRLADSELVSNGLAIEKEVGGGDPSGDDEPARGCAVVERPAGAGTLFVLLLLVMNAALVRTLRRERASPGDLQRPR